MDWNGQESFSLSCELWVGTNDFNTKKSFLVRSNPLKISLSLKRYERRIYINSDTAESDKEFVVSNEIRTRIIEVSSQRLRILLEMATEVRDT